MLLLMYTNIDLVLLFEIREVEGMSEQYKDSWIGINEAAEYLGVTKETIRNWIKKQNGIPAQKIGKLWKFKRSELDSWVKSGKSADVQGDTIMKKTYFPSNSTLEETVLIAVKKLGGTADVPAINQEVINILELPEEIVMLEDESGLGTKLDYRLRWCRTNLKTKHKLKNIKRGTWTIDDVE